MGVNGVFIIVFSGEFDKIIFTVLFFLLRHYKRHNNSYIHVNVINKTYLRVKKKNNHK